MRKTRVSMTGVKSPYYRAVVRDSEAGRRDDCVNAYSDDKTAPDKERLIRASDCEWMEPYPLGTAQQYGTYNCRHYFNVYGQRKYYDQLVTLYCNTNRMNSGLITYYVGTCPICKYRYHLNERVYGYGVVPCQDKNN